MKKKMRHGVFWPPFILLSAGILLSFFFGKSFTNLVEQTNLSILLSIRPLIVFGALAIFISTVAVCFFPLGKDIIGGKKAKPILTLWEWITISLCTNTAVGIFFWATAEPIYHMSGPPTSLGIAPFSAASEQFAISTLFMHWSLIPCALYTLPALMFALAFYNLRSPCSVAYCLQPLLGADICRKISSTCDSLALYALVTGMSASLGTGILTLSGGLEFLYGIKSTAPVWIAIGAVIVISFLLSALSGLKGGIRLLSAINTQMFFVLLLAFLFFAPIPKLLSLAGLGLSDFTTNFFGNALMLDYKSNDPWPIQWTVFYWAVWAAWAPVTAMFLGRIAIGYSVRTFVFVNLLVPALFAIVWMSILGSFAIDIQSTKLIDLAKILATAGPEAVAYAVMNTLPIAAIIIPFFLFSVFISYVTSADSNTLAMASMCTKDCTAASPEPPTYLKFVWAIILAFTSITMLCLSGLDGVRTLSYLGGIPALFFEVAAMLSLWIMMLKPLVNRSSFEPESSAPALDVSISDF